MKHFLTVIALSIMVSGCFLSWKQDTGDPVVDARVNTIMTVKAACSAYNSALKVFTAAVNADEVGLGQILVAQQVKKTLDPLCTSTVALADPTAVINQIQLGVVRLAVRQRGDRQ